MSLVLVRNSAVFGRREMVIREFKVSEIQSYAPYDATITISYLKHGKRTWEGARGVPDGRERR